MVAAQTQVSLPQELVNRLSVAAKSMGLDLAAYLVYLEHSRLGRLDPKSAAAAKFMFSKHGESLRKLAQ